MSTCMPHETHLLAVWGGLPQNARAYTHSNVCLRVCVWGLMNLPRSLPELSADSRSYSALLYSSSSFSSPPPSFSLSSFVCLFTLLWCVKPCSCISASRSVMFSLLFCELLLSRCASNKNTCGFYRHLPGEGNPCV